MNKTLNTDFANTSATVESSETVFQVVWSFIWMAFFIAILFLGLGILSEPAQAGLSGIVDDEVLLTEVAVNISSAPDKVVSLVRADGHCLLGVIIERKKSDGNKEYIADFQFSVREGSDRNFVMTSGSVDGGGAILISCHGGQLYYRLPE